MAELVRIEPALFNADEAWFVFDDGRKCLRKTSAPTPVARSDFPAPMIRRDAIAACRGADGRMHDSLSSLRRSYRPEGNPRGERYLELGDQELPNVTYDFDPKQRRDDIKAAIEDVKNGRFAPPPVVLEDL